MPTRRPLGTGPVPAVDTQGPPPGVPVPRAVLAAEHLEGAATAPAVLRPAGQRRPRPAGTRHLRPGEHNPVRNSTGNRPVLGPGRRRPVRHRGPVYVPDESAAASPGDDDHDDADERDGDLSRPRGAGPVPEASATGTVGSGLRRPALPRTPIRHGLPRPYPAHGRWAAGSGAPSDQWPSQVCRVSATRAAGVQPAGVDQNGCQCESGRTA